MKSGRQKFVNNGNEVVRYNDVCVIRMISMMLVCMSEFLMHI